LIPTNKTIVQILTCKRNAAKFKRISPNMGKTF